MLLVCWIKFIAYTHPQAVTQEGFTSQTLYIISIKEALTLSIQHPVEYKLICLGSVQGKSETPSAVRINLARVKGGLGASWEYKV